MGVIETEGLTKRFGQDVLAVNSLDLTVEAGEVFGFLGENGAGKSTTIDMLLDYVRPTSGTAHVLGYDAQEETKEIHQRIGILPDGYGLYDRLSGRKHVEVMRDSKDATDDPAEILDLVGLDPEDADRAVGGYSKGMAQRLVLGMALVGDPDLLILDEPSTGLDPAGARQMRDIVREEANRGATVFFSSHVLHEVERLCDRVGLVKDGRLVLVDTVRALADSLLKRVEISFEEDFNQSAFAALGARRLKRDGLRLSFDVAGRMDGIVKAAAAWKVADIEAKRADLEEIFLDLYEQPPTR